MKPLEEMVRHFWGYSMSQKVSAWHFKSIFLESNNTNLYCVIFLSICINNSISYTFFLICFSSLHFLVVMLTSVKFNNNIFVLIADQVASESNIPLSPQWLYAKPADAKALTAGILGVQKFTLVLSFCFFFPICSITGMIIIIFPCYDEASHELCKMGAVICE